jgi:phosphatidylinositol glycan class T
MCARSGRSFLPRELVTVSCVSLEVEAHSDLSHYYVSTPHLHLCTENLTPFLSLLPSSGYSGLSALLAQPHTVLSWGFKTEGIDVVMPSGEQGSWTGWWEGVVNLMPPSAGGAQLSRAFSISSLFKKNLPHAFPRAASSRLRVLAIDGLSVIEGPQGARKPQWVDGRSVDILEWDLLRPELAGQDIRFGFEGEEAFAYREYQVPAIILVYAIASTRSDTGRAGSFWRNVPQGLARPMDARLWRASSLSTS